MPDPSTRWVCLDVGETLIDETRIWSIWADALRIPRLTLFAGTHDNAALLKVAASRLRRVTDA